MKKTMNFFLVLGLTFTFLISACSGKGNSEVIGAWHLDGTSSGIQLNEDGLYNVILQGQAAPREFPLSHGKYTVSGDKITLIGADAEGKEVSSTSTFTLKDNALIMINSSGKSNKYIKQ